MGAVVEYGRPAEGKGTTLVPEPNVRTECRRRTNMRIVQLPHLPRCLAHQGQVPTFDLDRAKPLSLQRAYRSHDVAERLRLVELHTHHSRHRPVLYERSDHAQLGTLHVHLDDVDPRISQLLCESPHRRYPCGEIVPRLLQVHDRVRDVKRVPRCVEADSGFSVPPANGHEPEMAVIRRNDANVFNGPRSRIKCRHTQTSRV